MPNYRAFARDLIKLCKKHGVKMSAYDEGNVCLGPADAKTFKDFPFSAFSCTPTQALIGDVNEEGSFKMKASE